MQLKQLMNNILGQGDAWVVLGAAALALLLLVILIVVAIVRFFRNRKRPAARRPVPKKRAEASAEVQPGNENKEGPAETNASSTAKKEMPAESKIAVEQQQEDTAWIENAEIRPIPVEIGSVEGHGFVARDESAWQEKQKAIPAAWRTEVPGGAGEKSDQEPLAPLLDLESQRVDSALVSIPEYPVTVGLNLASSSSSENVAISRADGLFDVYRNIAFLRAHLRTGLDPAELFFAGMGGGVVVNCHPYVLFQPEFAHNPDIRRKTENILQTATAGYMQRGLDRLAAVEKEALAWTLRFLFWKGRLDKAISLLYRFGDDASAEIHRIRSLLATSLEDPILQSAFVMNSGNYYDRALLGIPAERMVGLRSTLIFQGITDTEDLDAVRPFEELDPRNARWLYLYLLHRGHLFAAFRMSYRLSLHDTTFEDETIYLAGIQGRPRLLLRMLLLLPARNTFFRLSALKHALNQLPEEQQSPYLDRLQRHWSGATADALDSVEPFAEFQGADIMRRNPGNVLGAVANPLDRSALLDWMDLAAYASRAGFHAGALSRAAVLLYTILSAGRPVRAGFRTRAERFLKKAALLSNVGRHYYILWLKDEKRYSEARQMAEYFIRRYPDLTYFHEQFISLSRN
ncbi:MAG: hypothetical protein KDK23_14350 [Leptospiraceae bacterium]|nr:hypothetical protein [Leptospiraceae bacterium]